MYTRRKVFSVVNDEDEYYERLYSEAFDEGVDYAEKMFAEIEAERNYSDGFEDGYDYAIQRMYAWNNENEKKLYKKFLDAGKSKDEAAKLVLANRSKAEKEATKKLQASRKAAQEVTDPLALKKALVEAGSDIKRDYYNGNSIQSRIARANEIKGLKGDVAGLKGSLKNWKIGAGVAGAAGLAGLGYGIYKGTRKDD
jgi:hypothetical protein